MVGFSYVCAMSPEKSCTVLRVIQRKQTARFQVILLLLLGLVRNSALAQSGASYTAERRIDTIVVDGNINEASWANAATTSVFTVWDGSPAPASLRTFGKMVWDDQYLYIA